MRGLVEEIRSLPQLRELTQALTGRERCAAVTGLAPVHRAMVTAAVLADTDLPLGRYLAAKALQAAISAPLAWAVWPLLSGGGTL